MENGRQTSPKGDGGFVSDKVGFKIEEEDEGQIPRRSLERAASRREQEDRKRAAAGDEQAVREAGCGCRPLGKPFSAEAEDDYGALFSQYSSALYSVAMEAVTQSLLSGPHGSSRKKSPAWKHFFISPRDSTKAICTYCMKEFSRGKNEKDLSTSCLMRHVRRAHPAMLLGPSAGAPGLASLSAPADAAEPGAAGLAPAPLAPPTAAKLPRSPGQGAEEAAPRLSPEEVPPDVSVPDRGGREEAPGGPPPLYDESPENGAEKNLPLPRSSSGSRRRSAVWKHFYLSPLDSSKAVCVHCMNEFSRGKNGKDLGTSCLIRHMWRAHRSVVLQENGASAGVPPPFSAPPTLLPAPPPPPPPPPPPQDGEPSSGPASPGKLVPESPCASPSPDRLGEELPARWSPGDAPAGDAPALSSSSDGGEASLASSPEKQQGDAARPRPVEPGAVFQQNKKVMKRLKSEVWHHFSLAPTDSLKAVCRHCACVISRGRRGDVGTSCLMRHLCRRHPAVVGGQRGFLGAGLAGSPYATLASAETASKVTDLPTAVAKNSQGLFPANSKKTSKLWNHFSVCSADPTKVDCLHCGRTISRGKKPTNLGTSCLLRHLQRFHGSVLKPDAPRPAPPASPGLPAPLSLQPAGAASCEDAAEKLPDSHPAAKKITSLVAEMIALDLQPYSVVDSVGFGRLLGHLRPQYSLPPASYFSRTAIPAMYDGVRHVVMAQLQEAESGVVHFTSGVWTSSQTREYLTLTAHWVTFESSARPHHQDRHCSALLDVSQVDCDYSGSSVQKQLECWWEAWVTSAGLQVGITVTDNPSIGRTLNEGARSSVQCFSHTVSLIVGEAIKSQRLVQNLLSTARKICERVHRSPRAKAKLAELQREYALPAHPLLQDVPSKWDTSLHMLERLLEQKRAVNELSVECHFRELISCDQWEVMQSVCHALRPFDAARRELGARESTLSQVIPMIHILHRRVEMLFGETTGVDTMLASLREAMVSRLSAPLHDPRYALATLLDPRYKASLFSQEEAEQYKQDLIRELETLDSPSGPAPVANGAGDPGSPPRAGARAGAGAGEESLWSLMATVQKTEPRGQPGLPEDAVLAYLAEEVLEHGCDPLAYWSLKRAAWPGLAALAVRFLACPPSAVPAEKLFGTPTESGSLGPSRLMMEHFEKLVFLRANLPLISFQY